MRATASALLAALALVVSALAPAYAHAQGARPGPRLDGAQEAHVHALFRQIRCVVCQNESIDDSEAPLAGDLRRIIREQVSAGRGDADIRRFLVDRYGQFVLLKPRLDLANALLWFGPFLLFGVALATALGSRRSSQEDAPLTPDEAERLALLRAAAPEATLPPRSRP